MAGDAGQSSAPDLSAVIPAQVGTQEFWIPTSAGMTLHVVATPRPRVTFQGDDPAIVS